MDILTLLGFLALLIIGIAVIVFVGKLIWTLIPAAIVVGIVFFVNGNPWASALAFLIMAALSALFKILRT